MTDKRYVRESYQTRKEAEHNIAMNIKRGKDAFMVEEWPSIQKFVIKREQP